MFFTISKILSYFLSPLFWILLLVFLALLLRKRRSGLRILVTTLILFCFFSNRFVVDEVVRAWEIPLVPASALEPSYDAAIVLGGSVVTYDRAADRLIFRETADKLLQTIELYKNGRIRYILLSGGAGDLFMRDRSEASDMRTYLLAIGIPDSVILVDTLSDNTHENARNSAEILQRHFPHGNFLLVTTALHMRRASGCFRKEGLLVTAYPTNKLTGIRRNDPEHLFIPQTESFLYWRNWLHEIIGYGVYKIKGYI
jgi:uncharacterized SAM-binding protein YcdF (DUF218 family)